MRWGGGRATESHYTLSSNLFHGQITQLFVDHLRRDERFSSQLMYETYMDDPVEWKFVGYILYLFLFVFWL